jgi:hypothetical protein
LKTLDNCQYAFGLQLGYALIPYQNLFLITIIEGAASTACRSPGRHIKGCACPASLNHDAHVSPITKILILSKRFLSARKGEGKRM